MIFTTEAEDLYRLLPPAADRLWCLIVARAEDVSGRGWPPRPPYEVWEVANLTADWSGWLTLHPSMIDHITERACQHLRCNVADLVWWGEPDPMAWRSYQAARRLGLLDD